MQPVPVTQVTLDDGFWRARIEANSQRGIPRLYERLETHGVVDNFRGAARRGLWFTDSDLYKWIEGASWSLAVEPDDGLRAMLDGAVAAVVAAQDDDGYLNTNFDRAHRFGDLSWSHELYCAGHLVQAAVAHHRATGTTALLDAAVRFADLLVATFGPQRREDRDRHPVIEMALVELARHTGDERYRELSRFFVDALGAHEWTRLWGHAVCACYFACGVADLAIDGDSHRRAWVERWFDDLLDASSYVTGGVGGRWVGESMGRPYELPGEGAYAETCGAVAAAQWAARMVQLAGTEGDVRAADFLELVLHNALLAGVSLGGDEWFYANPLASSAMGEHHPFIGDALAIEIAGPFPLARRPWRDVTCCPPNVNRALATLAGQAYLAGGGELAVVLYVPSRVRSSGFDCTIATAMPWSGTVTITVHAAPPGDATLALRIPGWSSLPDAGSWRRLRRRWRPGDVVALDLGVAPAVLVANPRVADARGALAVRRGPIVYCAEGVDNPGVDLRDVTLAADAAFEAEWRPELLGGVTVLRAPATVSAWDGRLYQSPRARPAQSCELTLVPYCTWANRGTGAMQVWLRRG